MPSLANAFDFELVTKTSTTACINFRSSDTSAWAYLSSGGISKRSAEAFCRTYLPSATTGIITDSDCYVPAGEYRYTTTVDCADKDALLSSCNVTGSSNPTYSCSSFYGAGIQCITTSRWDYYSSFTSSANLITNGTYGTQTDRSLTLTPTITVSSIRPSYSFSSGTLCIPPTPQAPGSNLAKALCRTAGLPASSNSAISNSSTSGVNYYKYASNIQCTSSSTATLFNGGCTNTTHYYDEPATACSPYLPEVTCPIKFDIKLGDTIVSNGSDSGFQLVKLRPEGSDDYDGMMCLDSYYTTNFANVMCREMYGDDIDFAVPYSSYTITKSGAVATGTKEYLSSVRCPSSTYANLSQCTATLTPTASQSPCTSGWGMVSCKLTHDNIVFSIDVLVSMDKTTLKYISNPGKGYLMAAVSAAGQSSPAAVCSDGFDQVAALAACRSVGYTPGPNAFFTNVSPSSTHAINNVTCPSTAKNLTECKLQYSGTGYKISYAARQVCSGRVYLDCDLGPPNVQFRTTPYPYTFVQARLYADSEWGWVIVGTSVTSTEGYNAMCQYSTSSTGDSTITKSFLAVSNCPSSATSYTDCTYSYAGGVSSSRGFYCSSMYAPSSYRSSSTTTSGLGMGGIIGLALGLPVGIIFLVGCVVCLYIFLKKKTPPEANNGIEMTTTNNQLPSADPYESGGPDPCEPAGCTPTPYGEGSYN